MPCGATPSDGEHALPGVRACHPVGTGPLGTASPNLYLVGYRATGKSTVARLLAEHLRQAGYGVVGWADTDELVTRRAGKPIAQVFADDGEPAFRDLEAAALRDLDSTGGRVVATGGGIVERADNRRLLRARVAVWLRATPATIRDRLAADARTSATRPSLTGAGVLAEVEAVLRRREALYADVSCHHVDTDGLTPEEVARLMAGVCLPLLAAGCGAAEPRGGDAMPPGGGA